MRQLRLWLALACVAAAVSASSQAEALEVGARAPLPAAVTVVGEPIAPAGQFMLPMWPGGSLIPSNAGDLYAVWPIYRGRGGDLLWELLPDPVPYANKTALALSPDFANDRLVMLGTDYGANALRLSDDGGLTWTSPQQPVSGPVRAIVFSPAFAFDRTVWLVLGWPHPLMRSTDGGQHWTPVGSPTGLSDTWSLALSPYYAFDQTLVAMAGAGRLYRSIDNGASWQIADAGLGVTSGNPLHGFTLAPLGGGIVALLVATHEAAVISFDLGPPWYLIDWQKFDWLAVPPDFAYSLTIYGREQNSWRLLKTDDLGQSWSEPMPGQLFEWIAFSPTYAQDHATYTGNASGLRRSTDGGQSWSTISSRPPYLQYGSLVDFELSPNFDNDTTLAAVTETGFYFSADGGRTWLEHGLPWAGQPRLEFSPGYASDHKLLLALGTSLLVTTNAGENWTALSSSLPFEPSLFEISPGFTADQTLFVGNYLGGLYRSTDNGAHWEPINTGLPGFVTDLDVSPGYPSDPTMIAVSYNTGLYRSSNGGASWAPMNNPGSSPDFRVTLSPAYAQDRTLFVGVNGVTSGGAYRSDDDGATWDDITGPYLGGNFVVAQAVSPNFSADRTLVMAAAYGPVAWSEDAGDTWYPLHELTIQPGHILAMAYLGGRSAPIVSAGNQIMVYQWPQLPELPSILSTGVLSDAAGVASFNLALDNGTARPGRVHWNVTEDSDWLTVSPVSGTLPAVLAFEFDAETVGDLSTANITIRRYLSAGQALATPAQVRVFTITDQSWLPVVGRGSYIPQGVLADLLPQPSWDLLTGVAGPRMREWPARP